MPIGRLTRAAVVLAVGCASSTGRDGHGTSSAGPRPADEHWTYGASAHDLPGFSLRRAHHSGGIDLDGGGARDWIEISHGDHVVCEFEIDASRPPRVVAGARAQLVHERWTFGLVECERIDLDGDKPCRPRRHACAEVPPWRAIVRVARRAGGGRIDGVVTRHGTPVTGLDVHLGTAQAPLDGGGRFRAAVSPGVVPVRIPGLLDDRLAADVAVHAGEDVTLDVALQELPCCDAPPPGPEARSSWSVLVLDASGRQVRPPIAHAGTTTGTLRGRAVDADSGAPVEGVVFDVRWAGGSTSAVTGPDGEWTSPALPAGPALVTMFADRDRNWAPPVTIYGGLVTSITLRVATAVVVDTQVIEDRGSTP